VRATPEQARPVREHERRLRAFATRMLADAAAAGFTPPEVIAAMTEQNADQAERRPTPASRANERQAVGGEGGAPPRGEKRS
jgi:hypothetical protein